LIIVTLALLLAGSATQASAQTSSSCESLFGPRVATPELFEVNEHYVLRIDRDASGGIEVAAIEPKYFYRDIFKEWGEQGEFEYLSTEEFEDLVERLEKLRPKGLFLRRDDSQVVTNTTCWRKAIHEKAVLSWGELCDIGRGESAPRLIRWIKVTYGPSRHGGQTGQRQPQSVSGRRPDKGSR